MSLLRARSGFWTALVAAWMLVLQSVAGALATGAGPDAPRLDPFGNPLCVTATDHADDASHGGGHSGLPNCCTLGCHSISAAAEAPADRYAIVVFLPAPLLAPAQDEPRPSLRSRASDPGRPRAPPLAV